MPARALSARRFVVQNALADVRSDGAENWSHFPVFLPTEGRFYSNGSYCFEDSAEMRIYDFDVPIKPVQPAFRIIFPSFLRGNRGGNLDTTTRGCEKPGFEDGRPERRYIGIYNFLRMNGCLRLRRSMACYGFQA